MSILKLRPNKQLARRLRILGLSNVVDSSRVRNFLGLPIRDVTRSPRVPPVSPIARNMSGPLVTIVVPAFNVADYLEDAVATATNQSHGNLQIVIVNDGSTDETGPIADKIAQSDDRVRVIHKNNGGLGAARNTGLKVATGDYIAFLDSDDQFTPNAIEVMLESLERTESDFAIGAVERFNSARSWVPAWVTDVHDGVRERIDAREHPAVLWDVFVWNKLFRKSVWDSRVGLFPEGVLYEDQECTARLYVEGATFDCLPDLVYRWRFRDDGSSITQNKHSTEDLQDRLLVARTVRGVLQGSASTDLLDTWYAKLLGDDLYWYFREVPRADGQFWSALHSAVEEFFAEASPSALARIRFDRRLHLFAIARGSRSDFEKVLFYFQEHGHSWQVQLLPQVGARGYVEILDSLSLNLSTEDLQVDIDELKVEVTMLGRSLRGDGSVVFNGFVNVQGVEFSSGMKLEALIRSETETGQSTEYALPVSRTTEPYANIQLRDPHSDYSGGGFLVTLPAELAPKLTKLGSGVAGVNGDMVFVIKDQGYEWRTTDVKNRQSGPLARLAAAPPTVTGERFIFDSKHNRLRVGARRTEFYALESSVNGEQLMFTITDFVGHPMREIQVSVSRDGSPIANGTAVPTQAGVWHGVVDLPRLLPTMTSNYRGTKIELFDGSNALGMLEADCSQGRQTSSGQYGLQADRSGYLQLERYVQFGEVHTVDLLDEGRVLKITGVCRFSRKQVRQGSPSLMLWHKNQTIHPERTIYQESSGEFTCEFDLTREDVDGLQKSFPMGGYLFGMLLERNTKLAPTFTLLASSRLTESFPQTLRSGRTRVTLQRRPKDGGLEVILAAPFKEDERGLFAQSTLAKENSPNRVSKPLKRAILFETFGGRAIADSPKAIDAILADQGTDLRRLWTVRDHSVAVPEGATPVLRFSREWYEAVATSQFLVNNNNFPPYFQKADGQTYIQTWHGTPLKRIGNDVPAQNLSLTYRKLMQREAEHHWDVLLGQSQWAGGVLSGAFGYRGPLFTDGYPRNDALVSASAEPRREKVRRYLGLCKSQMAVLYAPTWRDNLKASNGHYLRPDYLDPAHLYKAFGLDAVLLIRGHANNASASAAKTGPACIDVSDYPDINDLFLAADVLVTDYSSVQFDFIATEKPIVFLAPDLSEYRDYVRGFYFDFERHAPGPIARDGAEAVSLLQDLDSVQREYARKYIEYKSRFAGRDDGASAERFVSEWIH